MTKKVEIELDELELAKGLKKYCESTWCSECRFKSKGRCHLNDMPCDWEV